MNAFRGRFGADATFAPDGAHSPVRAHLGCHVVVRGYLADRAALCSRFGLSASDRPGDAELLAHAYRAWGAELQARVHGEYAAAIWDVQAHEGLLTHDALGVEPLFHARVPGGLAFATELVDLVDEPAAADLDEEYLADYLAYGMVTSERTPYRTIRRLLPGQSLRWTGGEPRLLRTWNLADVAPIACRDDGEYEERFRALLEAGVLGALGEPGRTGVSLSGGLDSSSIACVAAAAGRRDLAAYSIVSPRWPEADEQPWMRAVVERYGLPWHTHDIADALPFMSLPTAFLGEPTAAVIDEGRRRLHDARLRAHGVNVMLNGDGGDTVLCGSPGMRPRHLADPLFEGDALGALRATAAWKRTSLERRSYTYWVLRGLAEPAAAHLRGKRVRTERVQFPAWFRREYAQTMRIERRGQRRVAPRCRQPGRQSLWDDLWIGSLNMCMAPRALMSYELRKPLLYLPLVEFMCGIPWSQKLRPRCDRYLQRRALEGVLPELVRRRATKAGGSAPFIEGLRRSREWMAYLSDSPRIAARGIADADQWRHAVAEASVGQTHSDKFFFAGVAVEVWLKQLDEHRAKLRRPAAALASA